MSEIIDVNNVQTESSENIVTRTEKSSGAYRIIETGTAITFDMQSGIVFSITFDTEKNDDPFTVTVDVSFQSDSTLKERRLNFSPDTSKNIIRMQCVNFEPAGAGTATPVHIANYHSRPVYMHLWVNELGGTAGRKIDYCFYMA